mgnify:FL=1
MLCDIIRELRKSFNISQVQLANELGVTKQCVSNWENDNILPSLDMLLKIAKYFNVTTDYLLGVSNDNIVDVTGLNEIEKSHIKLLIKDLQKSANKKTQ